MKNQPEEKPAAGGGAATSTGSELARVLAILGVNLIFVMVAVVFTSTGRGKLPDLNFQTLMVGLLPVSAAMGLMLGCRRLDLSLPAVFALMIALRGNPFILHGSEISRMGILCGIGAGLGAASALVTWIGRMASALWTALLAMALWAVLPQVSVLMPTSGMWAWPVALAAALGALVVGGMAMGLTGMVALPSTPPIIRTGARGLSGLVGAWMVAGVALALAAQSADAKPMAGDPLAAYPAMLAAGALGGAYILRGRWGAVVAVALTCVSHLAWAFTVSTDFGSPLADALVPMAAPLAAVPLYLLVDRAIRSSTSESAPTGLLA
ncbi:MAG: hypothetical protein NT049_05170 [Planctomycetota bacterium]|nr:hypothetical protein [Planctomycetota bacterium]